MRHGNIRLFVLSTFAAIVMAFPALAEEKNDALDTPPWSMADAYWGAEEMARSREAVQSAHGAQTNAFIMAERLETQISDDEDTLLWDAQGWYGGDVNKLWVKTEGDYSFDENTVEEAEVHALWSRAVTPFWDFQAGVRYDFEPDGRVHGVLGLQGLAPYWFEVDAAGFVSEDGDVTARIEAEYELLLTQRLVLQPRAELELAAQDIPELEIGAGVTGLDLGIRVRYEIVREFAPYIGVEWQSAFGETADLIEADGGDAAGVAFLAGLRFWY